MIEFTKTVGLAAAAGTYRVEGTLTAGIVEITITDLGGESLKLNGGSAEAVARTLSAMGYTDCLTLTQSGRLAVALGGTQGFKPDWAEDFEGLEVFLAFDGDRAGREAAQKVAGIFTAQGLPAPKIIPLPDGQDVTDFFTNQRSKTRV